ncbi:MAG: hypothetical protein WD972_00845, partial [Candidatus Andersenbacteria bacterium]
MRTTEVLRSMDWILAGAALLLVLIGLAMLFSATYTQEGLFASRFVRQGAAFGVALVVALLATRLPYHMIQRLSLVVYGVGLTGLIVVALTA